MKTENVSTLKIHKLTQAQYDRELAAGNIDENALYLTPDEAVTPDSIGAAPAEHAHDEYAEKTYVGTIPSGYTESNLVAYINKKAQEVLTSASGGSSESAVSVLAALNTYKAENDPKVAANTTDIAGLKTKVGDTAVSTQINNAVSAITPANIGAAAASHTHDITDVGALDLMLEDITVDLSNHTHNYAGSSSAGGAATSANKVNKSLTVKLNGGSTEGTDLFTFNGSAAKSVNITPSNIGAANSNHTHSKIYHSDGTCVATTVTDSGVYYIRPHEDLVDTAILGSGNYPWFRINAKNGVFTDSLKLGGKNVSVDGHTHNVLNNNYYSDVTGTVGLYAAAKDRFYLSTPSDSNYELNLGKSDIPINYIYTKSIGASGNIVAEGAVASGTRVYVGNDCAFRGANAGVSPNDVQVETSQAIGWVNSDNNVVLGNHTNTGRTMLRAPNGKNILLQTNGVTVLTNSAGCIQFACIDDAYYFRPSLDATTRLGSASYKWGQIYSSKETISTSDRNLKKNIEDLDDRYIELFDLIRPVSYQLLKGDRIHTGFVAQEVEDAMEKVGLSAEELGFFCKDIKVVTDDESETDVPVLDEEGNPVYIYSLRYSEYIAIMAEKVRRQDKKIKELESKIVSYEERLTALENKL